MSASSIDTVDAGYLERAAALLAAPKEAGLEAATWPGGRILDVGCGPGLDTVALAQRSGDDARVDGVDLDPTMVAAAQARAVAAGLADRVTHHVAPADALPFPNDTYDVVRAERLLQHTPDAGAVVAELARVARPGGRIVLVDTDWASLSIAGDRSIERRLTAELQSLLPNPTAGRDLRALLAEAGSADIEVQPFVVSFTELDLARFLAQLPFIEDRMVSSGRIDAAEAERWRGACDRLDAAGGFYGHAIMTVATGRCAR